VRFGNIGEGDLKANMKLYKSLMGPIKILGTEVLFRNEGK